MKNWLLLALLVSSTASAEVTGISTDVWHTRDSEDLKITSARATGWVTNKHGISLVQKDYRSPNVSNSMTGAGYAADIKFDDYRLVGTAGLAQINSKLFPQGDVELQRQFNKNLSGSVGWFGDVVESEQGIANGVTFQGATVAADYSNTVGGVAGNVRQLYFSNGNTQTGWYAKPYINVIDGVNVYVSTRQYTNSDPYNGDFFSPEHFKRYNAGVGIRQRVAGVIVSGFVESGYAYVDGEKQNVSAWRLQAEKPLADRWTARFTAGRDVSANNNYTFNYFNFTANYNF